MIRLEDVSRTYGADEGRQVEALRGISFEIPSSVFVSVTGPSGCGKSTLLNLLASLDQPSGGKLHVGNTALHELDEAGRMRYRRHEVGIVFQFFNLLPTMTVEENLRLPLLLRGDENSGALDEAVEVSLETVGLIDRRKHFVNELSGGEMQRTAIARALIHRPGVLLADEPTGNLDSVNADRILEIFENICRDLKTTLVVVTPQRKGGRSSGWADLSSGRGARSK
ncbi:MAG: ABC transporter ATP-binding protein [Verrucomicrobiota bacterium]